MLRSYYIFIIGFFGASSCFALTIQQEVQKLYDERGQYWIDQHAQATKRAVCTTIGVVGVAAVGGYAAHHFLQKKSDEKVAPKAKACSQAELNGMLYEQYTAAHQPLEVFKQTIINAAALSLSTALVTGSWVFINKKAHEAYNGVSRWLGMAPFETFKELAARLDRMLVDHRLHFECLCKDQPKDQSLEVVSGIIGADRRLVIMLFIDAVSFVQTYAQYNFVNVSSISYSYYQNAACDLAAAIATMPLILSTDSIISYNTLLDSMSALMDQLGALFSRDLKIDE